jgi:hypothetical protein
MGHTTCCMSVMLSPFNKMRPCKGLVIVRDYWWRTYLVHAGVVLPLRTPPLPRPKPRS